MSDDELPPTGGMDYDDGSDDGMADMPGPGSELPEGITKDIIKEAPAGNWKTPKNGDEVTVHYVGTLQSDGSEFDSSRGRNEPFVFTLGKGQVIKGWDKGVITMKKGEIAKFTLAPEFAYGAAGSPPKIPENATLVFEVELISWASKDDLFGDEGVVKTVVTEGSGWKSPKDGDEVVISLKAVSSDAVVEEKASLEYVLGSDVLGPLAKACDKALTEMKKGEEVKLKCTKDYAYADKPDGATITLKLEELYETKDVSFNKDKSVMKKQVKQGEGYETPKDSAKVKLSVEAATNGTSPLAGFSTKVLEFAMGNGDVCDALECAVTEMKKGERSVLTVTKAAMAAEAQLGLQGATGEAKVVLTMELQDFEKVKETWDMSEEDKVAFGTERKSVGSTLFKGGRLELALQRYKKVVDLFSYIDNFKEENKLKAKELKSICELNKAACYLKLKDYTEAKTACNAVLKDEKSNAKALYRRAQAEHSLKNFIECIKDCKSVVEVDPQNRDARALLKQAQAGQKEVDKQAKGLFANMCKALGKGPIPEPGKSKRQYDDMEDDDDDAIMGDADAGVNAGADAGADAGAGEKADAPVAAPVEADVAAAAAAA